MSQRAVFEAVTDDAPDGQSSAPTADATMLYAAWLDPRSLLCVTTWPGRRSRQPLRGKVEHTSAPSTFRAFVHTLPADRDQPGGSLVLLAFDEPVDTHLQLGGFVLDPERRPVRVARTSSGQDTDDLKTLLRESLAGLAADTRQGIIDFLIDASGVDVGIARALALRDVRDALRERRHASVVAADVPRAIYVESIHRIDERGFYVRGWARDVAAETVRITALAPEGSQVELADHLYRYARPDLEEFYRSSSDRTNAGFLGFFQTEVPSLLEDGWIFEMEDAAGISIEFSAPAVIDDPGSARTTLLGDLFHEPSGTSELTRGQIHPAISRLEERRIDGIHLARVEQYGRPPTDPIVSIIVPLYGRIDFLEQQLAQFVHDPGMQEVDLVYVLDSPELATALLRSAGWMEALYGLPFRVAITDRNSGFAAANNLGASISRGRLLLLMNSDVFPAAPGWLGTLTDAYDSIPSVGVISPRLLYEDGSLQHAGLYFHFDRLSSTWNNEHFYKGLHWILASRPGTSRGSGRHGRMPDDRVPALRRDRRAEGRVCPG